MLTFEPETGNTLQDLKNNMEKAFAIYEGYRKAVEYRSIYEAEQTLGRKKIWEGAPIKILENGKWQRYYYIGIFGGSIRGIRNPKRGVTSFYPDYICGVDCANIVELDE